MRPKTSERAAPPLSALIAGGAVLVGVALLFGTAPDRLRTATAASTPTIIRFTVNEGTNISITRPSTGQWIIMDLHGFLYRLPPQGGQAVRITDVVQGRGPAGDLAERPTNCVPGLRRHERRTLPRCARQSGRQQCSKAHDR